MPREIIVEDKEEKRLLAELRQRTDPEGLRLKRFLAMPDLSRAEGSPIRELVERVLGIPAYRDLDVITVPEIVPARESFDLFNFPPDHPVRSRSDTYYVSNDYILRTHTTIMWYYYLRLPEVRVRIAKGEPVGAWSYGKVYRKDEIDRNHMNVFHQMDGFQLFRKDKKSVGLEELKAVLVAVAQAVFGPEVKYRFNPDTFPYTDPSLEMEVEMNGRWIEVLGSGVVHPKVLDALDLDPSSWNGWAFGSGLERLAILSMDLPDIRLLWSEDERVKKQLRLGNKFVPVSKFPPIVRDISFVVPKTFVFNNYFDLIRDIGGNLIEEVKHLDKYENLVFGENVSHTFRIVYRSNERTLKTDEIEPIQEKIVEETKNQFQAEIR